MKLIKTSTIALCCMAVTPAAQAINFNFSTQGFSSDAVAALDRAGSRWSSQLRDPVTINIAVNLRNLNDTRVIGNAASMSLVGGYTDFRDLLVLDAANETGDGIVSHLPTVDQASAYLPANFSLNNLVATKANLKALGESASFSSQLDSQFGVDDGIIDFNSGFAFDYDAGNGITPGAMDFETVAAHEIGHILGFDSVVDDIDYMLKNNLTGEVTPHLLDLFRFGSNANPATTSDFTHMSRDLRPGVASYFDDLSLQVAFSTGQYKGDGSQACHWKDSSGNLLGVMDPSFAFGQISPLSGYDLRALDVIGYEVAAVPLPAAIWLFGGSLLALIGLGRRERVNENG